MLFPVARALSSRQAVSALVRLSVRKALTTQSRTFIAPTISRRADFVQELYLKELKAYKVPPTKESDAQGQVQTFTPPKVPSSPEEADLASSLKEYEGMVVEVEGQEAGAAPAKPEDWYEIEDDPEDEDKH